MVVKPNIFYSEKKDGMRDVKYPIVILFERRILYGKKNMWNLKNLPVVSIPDDANTEI